MGQVQQEARYWDQPPPQNWAPLQNLDNEMNFLPATAVTQATTAAEFWQSSATPIPVEILHRVNSTKRPESPIRGGLTLLFLYSGKSQPNQWGFKSAGQAFSDLYPELSHLVMEVDIENDPTHDILDDDFYGSLLDLAERGLLLLVSGGPNCRTWSIRLHVPKPGGGKPLRERNNEEL